MAKAVMILGTASDVGKSVIAAGLCRIFYRSGLRVAPFKAQNMSLNSCATVDGGEIGWAQAAQAEACGVEAKRDMNPVLLKPVSGVGSQVILQGKIYRNMGTRDYYAARKHVWEKVKESYKNLAREFPLVVLEGAGGAAEINLRRHDLANFRMAEFADADVLLIGDIERGGVFASLVGTVKLLRPEERKRVKGFIINKFRGDKRLLGNGLRLLERETGIPVLGVVPYVDSIAIPEEDSVALARKKREERLFGSKTVNIAVIRLPHMANYTDFAELERDGEIILRYLTKREDLSPVDAVILPGTKNTLGDLAWLREQGWGKEISAYAGRGGSIAGICGGYQILGEEISDPFGVEGKRKRGKGLGLLPVRTELAAKKTVAQVVARSLLNGSRGVIRGYEIHIGRSRMVRAVAPAFDIVERAGVKLSETDGAAVNEGRVWGTYLHGVFADSSFREDWLREMFRRKGLRRKAKRKEKREPYDAWAAHLCRHLDMKSIFQFAGMKQPKKFSWIGKHYYSHPRRS